MFNHDIKPGIVRFIFIIAIVLGVIMIPATVYADQKDMGADCAEGVIVPDGSFSDWVGMPEIVDNTGDESPQLDIVSTKWFPDTISSNLYLYCERLDGLEGRHNNSKAVDWNFKVNFDAGGNKSTAFVDYHPESRQVAVRLVDGNGELIWRGKGKWGEDKYSANRVEFYVPLSYIVGSIQTGYQFDMNISSASDRALDTGSITVSTASTFPWMTAVMLMLWIVLLVFFNRQGMHFFKFIAGSVGLFMFAMILGSAIGEKYLENAVTWCLWLISQIPGSFSVFPGYSLVTVFHGIQAVSFIIDYECSGFIELLVFLCLLLFYPMFGARKKALYGVLGALFIFAANIVRLLFISFSIKAFGTPVFFLSHTVFARVLFFAMMVLLYYYVFTRPHIRKQKVGDLSYD